MDNLSSTAAQKRRIERKGIDAEDRDAIENYFIRIGDYDPDRDGLFCPPNLDAGVPESLIEQYVEWEFARSDSPAAKAFHYLSRLHLGNVRSLDDDPVGGIEFQDGTCPGVNNCFAIATNLQAVAGLQHRLLELGEAVQVRVG